MTVLELLGALTALALLLWVGRFLFHLLWPYAPRPIETVGFREHAETQRSGSVRVTVSALGREEGRRLFGVPLSIRGIQPVWIEVENGEDVPLFYLRAGTDPSWYSPYEAYWLTRFRAPRQANLRLANRYYALEFKNPIPPGQTRSGFVFTRLDEGTKALEALPPCTTDRDGAKQGDPLNLVLVGEQGDGVAAFARRGWHPTEQTYALAVWRTLRSFLFRSRYRYSPVSPLYVFGRRQDISARKARGSITLRNHARFWMTPLRYRGTPVWLGQISRDIGVRFLLGLPPTTHKIDPDVDEARDGLLQDVAYSQALSRFAYAKGVGAAAREQPRANLTGDPYFTDGLRGVLFFDKRPMTLDRVDYLVWEEHADLRGAARGPSRGATLPPGADEA